MAGRHGCARRAGVHRIGKLIEQIR
jgi:hypothetical protein